MKNFDRALFLFNLICRFQGNVRHIILPYNERTFCITLKECNKYRFFEIRFNKVYFTISEFDLKDISVLYKRIENQTSFCENTLYNLIEILFSYFAINYVCEIE